eukprot:Gb_40905 [translate_table: standard]
MAMDCVAEYRDMEKRPRKRARMTWDVAPYDEEVGLCSDLSCKLWGYRFEPPRRKRGFSTPPLYEGTSKGNSVLLAQPTLYNGAGHDAQAQVRIPSSAGIEFERDRAPPPPPSSMYSVKGVSRGASPPWREDDKDGHYMFELGENLTPRYCVFGVGTVFFGKRAVEIEFVLSGDSMQLPSAREIEFVLCCLFFLKRNLGKLSFPALDKILSKMGEGTFGRVLECWDREAKEFVAVKVVRSIQKYRDAAMIEIDVLRALAKHDKGSARYGIGSTSVTTFVLGLVQHYKRWTCLLIFIPPPLADMHELRLIHTDLKPENILLVSSDYVKVPDYKVVNYHVSVVWQCSTLALADVIWWLLDLYMRHFYFDQMDLQRLSPDETHFKRLPKSSAIKLIDFGSTTYESQDNSSVVSTRHYRAPEVILGIGWTYPCDIWSVGCILVELCSGEALFQTHENLEHLAMMERVLGPFPEHMIKKADRRAEKYFRRGTRLNWPEGAASRESIRAVRKLMRLRNLVMQHVDHSAGALIDLLQGLLKFEPSERLTARQALNHPFFTDDYYRRLGNVPFNS